MRVPPRALHGAAAVVLVAATVAVVAQSTVQSVADRFSVDRLLAGRIHVPPQACHLGGAALPDRRAPVVHRRPGGFAAYGPPARGFAADLASRLGPARAHAAPLVLPRRQ